MADLIEDHPYRDNNGPTYTFGVCRHKGIDGTCGKRMYQHSHYETARTQRSKPYILPIPGTPSPPHKPISNW